MPGRFEPRHQPSTLLQYVLDSVWTVADEILVLFDHDPSLGLIESIAPFGVKVLIGKEGTSALSRITAGVQSCRSENCLVVRASMPFVKPSVLFELFEQLRSFDAAVPRWKNGQVEPRLSVYRKKPFLKAASGTKGTDLRSLLDDLYDISFVEIEERLRPLDPELHSFFFVDTDDDLARARRIALEGE